jgi:hypothetical protein
LLLSKYLLSSPQRTRDEGSVMESDRRGCVVQLSREVNQQWEEARG